MSNRDDRREVEGLMARAEVYRLLSRGLGSAAGDGYDAALQDALAAAAWTGRRVPRASHITPLAPAAEASCPPYETEYTASHVFMRVQQLADVAGFYRAFGVRVGGRFRERPDHVAAELEFMYLLALKEARALADGETEHADVCRSARARFLAEHLGRWLAPYARKLNGISPRPGQARFAALARDLVAEEARRLGVRPEIAKRRTGPRPLEPEMACPPLGSEANALA